MSVKCPCRKWNSLTFCVINCYKWINNVSIKLTSSHKYNLRRVFILLIDLIRFDYAIHFILNLILLLMINLAIGSIWYFDTSLQQQQIKWFNQTISQKQLRIKMPIPAFSVIVNIRFISGRNISIIWYSFVKT